MSGLETLKAWLGETAVYECLHKPVPLTEYTLDTQSATLFEEPPRALLILNEEVKIETKEEEKRKAYRPSYISEAGQQSYEQRRNL